MPKRVVVISDLHAGHVLGLTHPDFNPAYPRGSPEYKFGLRRRELWNFYAKTLADLKPIDVLIVNGDAVDGKGTRSGGTELLTTDRDKQADMAAVAILEAEAGKVFMSYGTPYHTGTDEDWENAVASEVGAEKIGGHDWIDVNGVVIDYRHFVSRSIIPHGRHTPIARERLWNILWAEWGEFPKSDIIIRSHVHYFNYCGGFGWMAMTTPALQGLGSKYGSRIATGSVDFGLVNFDIESKENWTWQSHILKLRQSRGNIIKV